MTTLTIVCPDCGHEVHLLIPKEDIPEGTDAITGGFITIQQCEECAYDAHITEILLGGI